MNSKTPETQGPESPDTSNAEKEPESLPPSMQGEEPKLPEDPDAGASEEERKAIV
jgi:hypothetical protein